MAKIANKTIAQIMSRIIPPVKNSITETMDQIEKVCQLIEPKGVDSIGIAQVNNA